jgi:hypothetical protein
LEKFCREEYLEGMNILMGGTFGGKKEHSEGKNILRGKTC